MSPFRVRIYLLLIFAFVICLTLFFTPRFAQPLWYHDFADQRPLLGIPHACNVVSNLPFVLVGLWGIWVVVHAKAGEVDGAFIEPIEKLPYYIFVAFIALTGAGSAYYHAHPNNARLLWDRLPLAIAFMALFAAIIGERINRRVGIWLTMPLVLLGSASVIYWHWTESLGRGDLRWYLAVQFVPMIALPLLIWWFPPRYTRTIDLWSALGWYAFAKVLEIADRPIFLMGGFVSGHTLKHLAAAMSAFMIVHRIRRRMPYNGRKRRHYDTQAAIHEETNS